MCMYIYIYISLYNIKYNGKISNTDTTVMMRPGDMTKGSTIVCCVSICCIHDMCIHMCIYTYIYI